MIQKIVIPILLVFVLIPIQLVIMPLVSISNILPNVVLIYTIIYTLRNGQITGTIFAFFVGLIFDIASAGLIGSGMFSFTAAAFAAGYFHKDDFDEVLMNIKVFMVAFFTSSMVFFLFYSLLGMDSIVISDQFSFLTFALFSSVYNIIVALSIYLIPRNRQWTKTILVQLSAVELC